MSETKRQAVALLRRYDALRAELRTVERDLNRTVTEYGKERGVYGFNKDHFRIQIDNEERILREAGLERAHG